MNLFFLAAGLGTRLQPYTNSFPKPAIPFLNVPMGLYQFQYIESIKELVSTFTVNTHHLPDQIKKLYSTQPYFKAVAPNFSDEVTQVLGSAGGLKQAEKFFKPKEPVLLMNADEVYFTQNKSFLIDLHLKHLESKVLATLVVMKHPEAGGKFGAIWTQNESVKHIGKTCPIQGLQPWHFIGVAMIAPEVLKLIPPDIEQNILYDTLFSKLDQVQIFELDADWYETGNKEELLKTTEIILKRYAADECLQQFVNLYDPCQLQLSSLVSMAQNISNEQISGFNCISSTAKIEKAMHFENCIAFENQIIK